MSLYIKNGDKYLPIKLNSIINNDLNNHLIIVKVGDEHHIATEDELNLTADSFAKADVLNDLDNISLIVTSHNINFELLSDEEIDNKTICIQIMAGENISELEKNIQIAFKQLSQMHKVTIIPSPITIKEYKKVKDTLRRCKIRKKRRMKGDRMQ